MKHFMSFVFFFVALVVLFHDDVVHALRKVPPRDLKSASHADLELASLNYVKELNKTGIMTEQFRAGQETTHIDTLGLTHGVRTYYLGDGVYIVHNRYPQMELAASAVVQSVQEAPLYKGHFLVLRGEDGNPAVHCSNHSEVLSAKLKRYILGRCGYLVPRDYGDH